MRISDVTVFHCPAGSRTWSYLRMRTNDGVTGWAEFTDNMLSAHGLTTVIEKLSHLLIGKDPTNTRNIEQILTYATHEAQGGVNRRAAAALINASLDLSAQAAGVSVATLLGGVMHERLPLYWSHCGLVRMRLAQAAGNGSGLRSLDDVVALGAEVRERGYRALKTNLILFDSRGARLYLPAWGGEGSPSRELGREVIASSVELVDAFREGAGDDVELMFDVNFNIKGEGVRRMAHALGEAGVTWFEVDSMEPSVLRQARTSAAVRVASGESLSGLREYRQFFEADCIDMPIVDIAWNGVPEAVRVADLANSYDLNIAPHNYASNLLTHMNAQFAASLPNLSLLEYDVDGVAWRDEIVSPPLIEDGQLVLENGTGWGCQIDEDALEQQALAA
jgi:galactonate dehydratase